MTFFFLKNPNCLDFIVENKDEPSKLQILEKELEDKRQISNTKLCKRKNGTWFIQCGNIKMEMNNIAISNMKVAEKTEEGGNVIGYVTKKWFIKPGNELKEIYKQN